MLAALGTGLTSIALFAVAGCAAANAARPEAAPQVVISDTDTGQGAEGIVRLAGAPEIAPPAECARLEQATALGWELDETGEGTLKRLSPRTLRLRQRAVSPALPPGIDADPRLVVGGGEKKK